MVLEFFLLYSILLVFIIKNKGATVLTNDLFWLFTMWFFIFGIFYSANIDYAYKLSSNTIIFLLTGFFVYLLFRKIGFHVVLKNRKNHIGKNEVVENRINTIPFFVISLIGSSLYLIDIIRINGLAIGVKSSYSVSTIGALSFIFVPIMLVIWIYEINYSLRYSQKIKRRAYIAFVVYFMISFTIAGRQAIFYIILSTVASVFWSLSLSAMTKDLFRAIKNNIIFRRLKFPLLIFISIVLVYYVFLSNTRYGDNYIQTFEYAMGANFPDRVIKQSEWLGGLGKIFLNIILYFSHQLSKLEIVFQYYEGPYLFGLYQLNVISRRLPLSWGLDYRLVSWSKRSILASVGQMGLATGWDTIWGSLISDFGRLGSIVVVALIGLLVGKSRKNFSKNNTVMLLVFQALICVGMYTTVQIGPFFDIGWLYAMIWWKIIVMLNKNKIKRIRIM